MSNYENLRPGSLWLKPVDVNNDTLSSNCRQRRSFTDRLFSKGKPETANQNISESSTQMPKFIRQQSFPGILRTQNDATKNTSLSKSLQEKILKTAELTENNLLVKPVPARKVVFKEHIESVPCRPPLQRGFGVDMEQSKEDDTIHFPRNEDGQDISNSKDNSHDTSGLLLLDNSDEDNQEDQEETYLPSFDLYKEALTQCLFSSDEDEDDSNIEEDECDYPVRYSF